MIDYRELMGVEDLSSKTRGGEGVKIAILDSGTPRPHGDDAFGHATIVSGILFGRIGKQDSCLGICEHASPCYFKVLDDSGVGTIDSVVDGIHKAIDQDVDLINLSLGFMRTEKCPKSLEKACDRAYAARKTIICAAGNDGGSVNWPAALESTICVGSASKNGLKTAYSSVGEVDFVAPGQNLRAIDADGRTITVNGTSFSCALVSGVTALLISDMKARGEVVEPGLVWTALLALSQDVEDIGWDSKTGYGMISGENPDPTVCMMPDSGIFDKIIGKIKSLVGLGHTKENTYGSRV